MNNVDGCILNQKPETMTIKSLMDVDEKLISKIIGEAIVLDELKHK